ncbi:MAG: hypothetical protein QXL60_04885 [Nitrososphaerota archaeon]
MMSTITHMEKSILGFMNSLLSGRFAEAERSLERMEKRFKAPEERRVVFALRGLLNAYQLDDRDALILHVFTDGDPPKKAVEILEALEQHLKELRSEADPYFDAWRYILRNIKKLPTPHRLKAEEKGDGEEEPS